MRTVPVLPLMIVAPALLVGGCYPFETVDEACLDSAPREAQIDDVDAQAAFRRANCYRRVAKRPKMGVGTQIQDAVEGHANWLDMNMPDPRTGGLFNQLPNSTDFTGANVTSRLENAGYIFTGNTEILELFTIEADTAAGELIGEAKLDFWFANPFVRPAFLQATVQGAGVEEGLYAVPGVEELGIPSMDVSYQYWTFIYTLPPAPYAEAPAIYPRNGQIDAPPSYTHLSSNPALEYGRTYGYPITFTVGTSETGLEVTQASFQGPGGPVPFTLLTGADAITAMRLRNTAIIVPEAPLQAGAEYQVDVKIVTSEGERRAQTTFTTGGTPVDIPQGLLSRTAPEQGLRLEYRSTSLGERIELAD